uniref:histone deacetylase n=1 Tax=Anopheles culicifacies TaxID=139723 RepID=A0A182MLV0_9DIPT
MLGATLLIDTPPTRDDGIANGDLAWSKGGSEMARDSTMGRDRVLVVPNTGIALNSSSSSQITAPADISQQILELQKEQELEKQKLWHAFQEKNKELEMQHRQQLEHKFQELRDQRIAEEAAQQRERREREAIKRKEKHECCANASSEVKQKLQTFLIQKKQAAASNGLSSPLPYRNWGVVKSSSGESLPGGAVAAAVSSHPYKIPPPPSSISKYDPDFPLRKTGKTAIGLATHHLQSSRIVLLRAICIRLLCSSLLSPAIHPLFVYLHVRARVCVCVCVSASVCI